MATSNLPIRKEMAVQLLTDEIGDHLQREYGSEPPSTHIGCFYIKLGQEISNSPISQKEALDTINRFMIGPNQWVKSVAGWDGVLFFQNSKATTNPNNERDIELKINDTIRRPLITDLSKNCPDIHIMFSRACLYTEKIKRASSQGITTENIGEIMENLYEHDGTHIKYFYLFVQGVFNKESFVKKQINNKDVNVHSEALKELKTLPGDWKSVEPPETWLGTFFGFFPKGMQAIMTEREREKILNGEVRMPLMERLEAKLRDVTPRDGLKIKVQVIITRACKYTEERMDTTS